MRVTRWAATTTITCAVLCAPASAAKAPRIEVISSRADLVSAGNALVAVTAPKRSGLKVRVNGRNVTKRFARRVDGRLEGVVRGLRNGRNVVTARLKNGRAARLKITNHPNGGPLFSGPQIQPWKCQAGAVDAQCNQPAQYSFLYKATGPASAALKPYDPQHPPSDVATTTTDQGVQVPFVVRREMGYQDRDQYVILTLFDPAKPWSRWNPQPQWNHKVFVPHGGGCGSAHETDDAPLNDLSGTLPENPAVTNSYVVALSRGFAVMSTALDNLGHNCNVSVAAESLMMAKEHLTERYGDIRYTIGSGCSGGSITQQTVANAYPRAVYDGLTITCAYPDAFTALVQFGDYHLLRRYFESTQGLLSGITPLQWGLIEGRPDPVNAITADEIFFKPIPDPSGDCGVPADQRYDRATRPGGVRCGLIDFLVNLLGPRAKAVWSPNEQAAGHGFAGIPFGNAGVQYGLGILKQGLITPDQFVDLNARIGGLDVDFQPTVQRFTADSPAVANAYRSGTINEANNLSGVAIIHFGGPDPGAAHDYAHSLWIRDRIQRAQGNHDNHVLWYGPTPLFGDANWLAESFIQMDHWLGNVEADRSSRTRAEKIAADKPAGLADRCPAGLCTSALGTAFGTSRTVAGGDKYNDVVQCTLKPLDRGSYGVPFTDAQWARMQATFPTGVCDWDKPGVGQQPTKPFQTYGTARKHFFGGRPLGPAPRSHTVR